MRIPFLLAALFLSAGAAAQPSAKDPGQAQLYSVVLPGGGQFYTGETVKGAVILAGVGGGLAAAAAALPRLQDDFQPRSHYERYGVQFGAGLGVAGALWLYGVLDAPNGARRANERNGIAVMPSPDGATVALCIGL